MKYNFTIESIDTNTTHGKVLNQIKSGSRVLECGCSSGYITKFLKEQLNCKVSIIECDEESYNMAKQYAEDGVCANLNDESCFKMFEEEEYDYILFMDVLEHLVNPQKTLKLSVAHLKEDGVVLITLPNVAHNDILIDLYQNSFNYSSVGLLDESHVKFFAKNNLETLIYNSGLRLTEFDRTYVKTGQTELFWHRECRIPEELFRILSARKEGEVYQFVLTARKEEFCEKNKLSLCVSNRKAELNSAVGILDIYQKYTQELEKSIEMNQKLQEVINLRFELEKEKNEKSKLLAELDDSKDKCIKIALELEETNSKIKELELLTQRKQNKIEASELMTRNLRANYDLLTHRHNQIVSSRGWKLLSVYYKVRDLILPVGSLRREFVKRTAKMFLSPFRKLKNKLRKNVAELSVENTTHSVQVVDGYEFIKQCKRIDVLSVGHTAFIAKMLQGILEKAGVECHTHLTEPEQYENIPYIMVCPQNFKKFPPVYIAFQMEQTINPRWLTEEYISILHNAYAVFDYSLENIKYFSSDPILASKLYYLPVDVCDDMVKNQYVSDEKEYDVLFYGAPFVDRRQAYLKPIGEKYKLKVISNLFGPDLYREMSKAKVIINIHYYENALLETTRIYETLSVCDSLIISERSGDPAEEDRLNDLIDFVPVGDVNAMIERIEYWLQHNEERIEAVKKNKNILEYRANAAQFYLNRFLLANDRVSFDDFYNSVGDFIHFDDNRICLSLPESTSRHEAFETENKYGFSFFPALKHRMGWIGAGMSYKFMLRKALEQDMENILICEDDVYFPPDFKERFDHVLEYVKNNDDWNVFSGIMADIGRVKTLKYVEDNGEEFIYLDKMISMVFNIYDKSIFEAISSWDYNNRDVHHNTIDRYLESKQFRVLTTCPFLVGHKEDLFSTIWGQQNTIYSDLIAVSSEKLKKIVEDYKSQNIE